MRGRDGVLGPLQPRLLLHPGQTLPLRGLHSRPGPGGVPGGRQVLELYCTVLYCTVLYCTVQVLELCWHGVPGRLCQARQGRPGVQRQQPGQDRAPPRVLDSGGRAGARLEGLRRHRHPRHSPQQGEDCWEREQRGRHRTVRGHGGDGQQVPGGGRAEIEQADVVFSVCTQSPGTTVRPSNSRTGSRFSPTAVLPV